MDDVNLDETNSELLYSKQIECQETIRYEVLLVIELKFLDLAMEGKVESSYENTTTLKRARVVRSNFLLTVIDETQLL